MSFSAVVSHFPYGPHRHTHTHMLSDVHKQMDTDTGSDVDLHEDLHSKF